jgi:hypothetical protein
MNGGESIWATRRMRRLHEDTEGINYGTHGGQRPKMRSQFVQEGSSPDPAFGFCGQTRRLQSHGSRF